MSLVQTLRNPDLIQKLGAVPLERKDGKKKGRRKGRSVRTRFECKKENPKIKTTEENRCFFF